MKDKPEKLFAREPIAIVGIGCRFPGAIGPEQFWGLLRDGVDAVSELPGGRFDIDAVYDPAPGTPGKIINRAGGFLTGIDEFDSAFFGISPREALRMDPQQRLLLEVTWEAVEDAGLTRDRLTGSRTGVFIGAATADYQDIQYYLRDRSEIDFYAATGTARSVLSGRLSYAFDLRGPSLTVDTACSSSLVAVHLACESLWSAESEIAIAGGVNLVLLPELSMPFSRAGMLALDCRCRFGDARASGFTRSDGIGVVMLKRLSNAKADRDCIYAMILGSAINNDGRSSGLLATPGREGQQEVLRKAYLNAGVSPAVVEYIEAHGTGTGVGDPIEIEALSAVVRDGRASNDPCMIGSVKTNIGHSEGAAGIAGLIKVALSLKHRAIPPSLHLETPNPAISWDALPVQVCRELTPWSSETPIAGVSAFGISATNAHVVLQGMREGEASRKVDKGCDSLAQVFTLSAHTDEALAQLVTSHLAFIHTPETSLHDLCYTASARRTHHEHRLAIVACTRDEITSGLEAFRQGETRPGLSCGRAPSDSVTGPVFVFAGQGSQWLGMGCGLVRQAPVFRSALARCEEAIGRYASWSLMEELSAGPSRSRFGEIDVVQPCLFSIQVALAELWRHWGFEPAAVIGQSMGEIAAAHVAGALSLDDAARIICRRSRLLRNASGKGGMAVVGLSLEDTEKALADYQDRLAIAVSSSPRATVIAGDLGALKRVTDTMREAGVFCQDVRVDVASHTAQMDPLREDLLEALAGIDPRCPSIPIYSTVTGNKLERVSLDSEYWAANLRKPVLFSAAVLNLLEDGHNTFIEISPHPVLAAAIRQTAQSIEKEVLTLPSLQRDEDERGTLVESVAALFAAGYDVEWSHINSGDARLVPLPPYPWQPQHFWLGPDDSVGNKRQKQREHLLSRPHIQLASDPNRYVWEADLGLEAFPFLKDHCIEESVVLPASAYLEMAMRAGRAIFGDAKLTLERVEFKAALVLSDKALRLQLIVHSQEAGGAFEFYSLADSDAPTLHATGHIVVTNSFVLGGVKRMNSLLREGSTGSLSSTELYGSLADRGLRYGPAFQGVKRAWIGEGSALGEIALPQNVGVTVENCDIHPVVLDCCFQVLAANVLRGRGGKYLPVGLERLRPYDSLGQSVWAHTVLRPSNAEHTEVLTGDVTVIDSEGRVLLEAAGLSVRRVDQGSDTVLEAGTLDDLFFELQWKPAERLAAGVASQGQSLEQERVAAWIVFADRGPTGQRVVELLEGGSETCVIVSEGESFAQVGDGHFQLNRSKAEDYTKLLENLLSDRQRLYRGLAHLWSLDAPRTREFGEDVLLSADEWGWDSVLMLVQTLGGALAGRFEPPRIWLVTRGAQAVTGKEDLEVAQSPVWGLGRVIAREHPKLRCSLVDLGTASNEEIDSLVLELRADGEDDQIALRGGERYVPGLAHSQTRLPAEEAPLDGRRPFRLHNSTPGMLDGLSLHEAARIKPGPSEVEIRVQAIGLNFRDVMLAMGVLPSDPRVEEDFGWECAGKVVAVGEGVEEFAAGDDVFAIAHPCFSAYATTHSSLVLHKPPDVSFELAASLPLAFLTAHYALNHLGRIQRGERVLLHSASGGVGLAAIQVARQQGAEIFATAGSEEKREFLRSLGIQHVFDSRSLQFVDEIKQVTGGEGVDVVLNSLPAEAIPAGLSVLRSGGRFLELSRHDIYKNSKLGLAPFQNNLAFFAIDLSRLIRQTPAAMGALLRDAIRQFASRSGRLSPLQCFSIANAAEAFRCMANARHIGKIGLRADGERARINSTARKELALDPGASYLISGGLGGLGLAIARRLIERGARRLVLVGRTRGSSSARAAVKKLRETAEVVVATADVAKRDEIAKVFARIKESGLPLKGVVHAAGLLDDGILLHLDRSRFRTVMAPKVGGAWNLHSLTLGAPLDFFVLFSSAATLFGSAGQGNYSAANAFLDSLAHYRRLQGLPALSLNWGPWSEVGLAAEGDRIDRLAQLGMRAITPAEGVDAFESLINAAAPPQVGVMAVDSAEGWRALGGRLLMFDERREPEPASQGVDLNNSVLAAAAPAERGELVQSYLGTLLARVLGIPGSGQNRLDANRPMNRLGLDSLMALEMKTRIEGDLGVQVAIPELLKGASLRQLATKIVDKLNHPAPFLKARGAGAGAGHWEELRL